MNYLVAVLPNRIQAEAAYSALEKEGLPKEQIDILRKSVINFIISDNLQVSLLNTQAQQKSFF